jgi:methionyl-tRNA formyltransferase
MIVQILIDNRQSWIISYAQQLKKILFLQGMTCSLIHYHSEVIKGEVLLLLSCEKKFTQLELNEYNLVVHESALPKGKGWSPMTWQILESKTIIPITLFEAGEEIDAGPIYESINVQLDGTELIEDWRKLQGEATIQLILNFIKRYPKVKSDIQIGNSSFYSRRKAEDSELDCSKSIAEQFNILRVSDNERYPAFFYHKGQKYKLKIEKYD